MEESKKQLSVKEQNQRVKDYLNYGRVADKKIRFVERQIEELESSKKYPSMANDGMPHGSNQKDLSDYIVAKERLQNKLLGIRTREMERKNDILDKLEKMDMKEAEVLRMFHLERMLIRDIAEEMGYSEQHIHRIHSKALQNFKLDHD